jgi:uridine kinase
VRDRVRVGRGRPNKSSREVRENPNRGRYAAAVIARRNPRRARVRFVLPGERGPHAGGVHAMYLIGIAGPSGAGKTELARALAGRLAAPILALDSYYRDSGNLSLDERARHNFDDPEALDHELLRTHLMAWAAGQEIDVPVYDFTRHVRTARTLRLRADEYGIVEGLWTLYREDLRRVFGTKVFIQTADEVCFTRRMARDMRERGRSAESVLEQYTCTVRPMAERFVLPTACFADVVVSGEEPIENSVERVLEHVRRS